MGQIVNEKETATRRVFFLKKKLKRHFSRHLRFLVHVSNVEHGLCLARGVQGSERLEVTVSPSMHLCLWQAVSKLSTHDRSLQMLSSLRTSALPQASEFGAVFSYQKNSPQFQTFHHIDITSKN